MKTSSTEEPKIPEKENQLRLTPQCSTVHSLQGFNSLNSPGHRIQAEISDPEWMMLSWDCAGKAVLQGHQDVQKLRGQVYSEEVIEEELSQHYGGFCP